MQAWLFLQHNGTSPNTKEGTVLYKWTFKKEPVSYPLLLHFASNVEEELLPLCSAVQEHTSQVSQP